MNNELMAQRHVMTHHALGTRINLTIFGNKYFSLLKKSMDLIDRYEDQLTVNRNESEVMSVNHGAGKTPKMVSPTTFDLIELVVKLWKIGFAGAHVPSDAEIKERLKLIDPYKVLLNRDARTVYLEEPGMELDLGGIAKGYIADRIRDLWIEAGVPAGVIDLGGNLLFVGKSPRRDDGQWIIGVQDPQLHRGENLATVREPACSAVTSGIYERFLIKNGRRYHHLLDPRTGYPLETDLSSVTVFTDQSVMGEIEAKRLFFSGEPIAGWETRPGNRGAIFIRNDESMVNVGFE